ncbi:MAG: hypothetical protein ACQETL_19220 [Bacteroidota bacterium]
MDLKIITDSSLQEMQGKINRETANQLEESGVIVIIKNDYFYLGDLERPQALVYISSEDLPDKTLYVDPRLKEEYFPDRTVLEIE